MQCRYLDNSFKLYKITKVKNSRKKEKEIIINSYSYICEDFVSSCCPISSNQFVVGLENGKLIRWNIYDLQNNRIKLIFDKDIQAHRSRINAIETDKRLGLIITCGNDNFIQIRKLYNLELITPIQISQKYIVTMAKVSPINLLYVMCFDKVDKKSFILGYTLSGIKFAKSEGGYYGNIDFTRSGNIVSLLNNKEICILNAYDLKRKDIKKESGYIEFKNIEKKVEGSVWMEYKYLFKKKYNTDGTKINNIIVYMKHGKRPEDSMIFYYDFKGNNIFD
jgi:WD40 repeat protein